MFGCSLSLSVDESKSNGVNPWTYNRYDGLSGDLDANTNEASALKGHSYILGLPYRLSFYKCLMDNAHFLLANGAPANMEENRLGFPRMVEAHRSTFRAYETHFHTPLAYTSPSPSVEVIRECLMMGTIPFRVRPGGKSDVLKHFFPITVSEIGRGFIIGDDRVITAVSGAFSLASHFRKGVLHLFRKDGVESKVPETLEFEGPLHIRVPDDGIVILVGVTD